MTSNENSLDIAFMGMTKNTITKKFYMETNDPIESAASMVD